jgi:hypothetical protein
METKFNLKSQICTSREQSERLLALGLKKETADCNYPLSMIDWKPCQDCPRIGNPLEQKYNAFPAWSLHRLLSLYNLHYIEFMNDEEIESVYDIVIDAIEQAIKEGYFNKEYLEE